MKTTIEEAKARLETDSSLELYVKILNKETGFKDPYYTTDWAIFFDLIEDPNFTSAWLVSKQGTAVNLLIDC